jgi:hypothetical protein
MSRAAIIWTVVAVLVAAVLLAPLIVIALNGCS